MWISFGSKWKYNYLNNICIKEIPDIVLDKYNNIKDNKNIDIITNDINIDTCNDINFEFMYHRDIYLDRDDDSYNSNDYDWD